MKKLIKKIIPKKILNFYHGCMAWFFAAVYGFPSRKLVVIGVTGTNGKSTTVNLIAAALEQAGEKVALSSTVNFRIAGQDKLNDLKMTMPGRGWFARFLKKAVDADCAYAVIETSSEGLAQNRHWGIQYDVAVFTNLTPEHIESHGSFENYKKAKLELFSSLSKYSHKQILGRKIPKIIVANLDDAHAPFFLNKPQADLKITYGQESSNQPYTHIQAQNVQYTFEGITYNALQNNVKLNLRGKFDVYNSLAALACAEGLEIDLKKAIAGLAQVKNVPGRMELIQKEPFLVLVDYAPEPESLKQLFASILEWQLSGNIVHVLGSTGGGRDRSRRPVLGELSGRNADICIVTNEDPYNDDPKQIIDEVAAGAEATGKILNKDLFKILDRRQAIKKALQLAKPGDLVLVTGKGAEQKMAVAGGRYIDWDDRAVIREELEQV